MNRNDENGDKAEQDYTYSNPQNNQLSQVDWNGPAIPSETHAYNYDANGNILADSRNNVINISYDDYDELPTSITNDNGTRNYCYDNNGQRIVKEVDVNDKNYYLDGVIVDQNNEVVSYQTPEGYASVSNSGGIVVDYFYSIPDWLGTNRAIMDAAGNVVNAHDHYPFGKRMPGRYMVADAEGNRYQYTGHEFDGETGYGYHGARYYNRELGRYMNVDRYAEKFHDQSPYVYAGDMPINAVDVNGDSLKFQSELGENLYNAYRGEINGRISDLKSKIAGTDKKGKLKRLNNQLKLYQGINAELDGIESSTDFYRIRIDQAEFASETSPGTGANGNLAFNRSTLEYDVNVKTIGTGKSQSDPSAMQYLAHELKHADQVEKYQLDHKGNFGGKAYDQNDELEAVRRQNLFGTVHQYRDPEAFIRNFYSTRAPGKHDVSQFFIDPVDPTSYSNNEKNFLFGLRGRQMSSVTIKGDAPAYKSGIKARKVIINMSLGL